MSLSDQTPPKPGRYRKTEYTETSPVGIIVSIVVLCGFLFFGLSMLRMNSAPSPSLFPGNPSSSLFPGGPSSSFEQSRNFGQIFILFWCGLVVLAIIGVLMRAAGAKAPSEIVEIEDLNQSPASTTVPSVNPGVRRTTTEALRELEQLRRENLISQTEYDAKRRELLARL